MENTKNEKKEALLSAVKYTYVGLLNTLTFAYITQYNIYIATFLLLLTIFISSSVYHGQLKVFRINKKYKRWKKIRD